eukprot:6475724-Amphidinium_carterae.2
MADAEDALSVRLGESPRQVPVITGFGCAAAVFSMATPRDQMRESYSPRSPALDVTWLADALTEAQRENARVRMEVIEAESSRQSLRTELQQNMLWAQQQGGVALRALSNQRMECEQEFNLLLAARSERFVQVHEEAMQAQQCAASMIENIKSDRERLWAELQGQAQTCGRVETELASVQAERDELTTYNRRGNATLQDMRSELDACAAERERLLFELGVRDDELALRALEQQGSGHSNVVGPEGVSDEVNRNNPNNNELGYVPSFSSLHSLNGGRVQSMDSYDMLLRRATNQGGSVAGVFRGVGPSTSRNILHKLERTHRY